MELMDLKARVLVQLTRANDALAFESTDVAIARCEHGIQSIAFRVPDDERRPSRGSFYDCRVTILNEETEIETIVADFRGRVSSRRPLAARMYEMYPI